MSTRDNKMLAAVICCSTGAFVLGAALTAHPETRHRTGMIIVGFIHVVVGISWFLRALRTGHWD